MSEETPNPYEMIDANMYDEGHGKKGKKRGMVVRKNPDAPKRFKSSYICFFVAKQSEIKEELGEKASVMEISKRSAEIWKHLSPDERKYWDDIAAKDKERYLNEKATYTGPWQVAWKRNRKDPSAPKRPMSAFLLFSQGKRTEIKEKYPEMKNTDVSRTLGELWRDMTDEERKPFIDREREEREKYKEDIAEWRKEHDEKVSASRKSEQDRMEQLQAQHSRFVEEYGHPPSLVYGQLYPAASYHIPPNPYAYPINGKQPIVLGPNGMPYQQPQALNTNATSPAKSNSVPSPSTMPYAAQEAYGGDPGMESETFDYSGENDL